MSAAGSVVLDRVAVFLLAENRLLREALSRILDKKSDIVVTGSCAFSALVLEQVVAAQPDVLILDSMTGTAEYSAFVHELRRQIPHTKLVMIGMEDDEHTFLRCVREGVQGYVLKEASALEVVSTVRAAANGEATCPPHLCAALFRYVARQSRQVPNFQVKLNLGLTHREQQLVLLIGRGFTNKEIASQLQLAEQTVRNHVHRMLRKVGANDRLAVVEMCRLQGLPV